MLVDVNTIRLREKLSFQLWDSDRMSVDDLLGVFAPEDRPIFTGVLSARLGADTVTLGLPAPTTQAKVVMAAHPDHLPLGLSSDDYELGRIDADRKLCLGCHRTLAEIAAWGRMTPDARARVMAVLPARQDASDMPRRGS